MADISASMVRDLRDKTGAGMMDCKKALVDSNGDLDQALDLLRKAGLAKAEKRAGRATTEGKVAFFNGGGAACLIELLCETDFASRNEKFTTFAENVAKRTALDVKEVGDVTAVVGERETNRLADLTTNIGESMQVRRAVRWQAEGKVGVYLHGGGRIGVMAEVLGPVDEEYLTNLCMHIAAFNPQYLVPADIPAAVIEKEKEIAAALPDVASKPADIREKIVMGRISKWYAEVCLTKQPWVRDDKQSVEKVNPKAKIVRFVRWQVGEGI